MLRLRPRDGRSLRPMVEFMYEVSDWVPKRHTATAGTYVARQMWSHQRYLNVQGTPADDHED